VYIEADYKTQGSLLRFPFESPMFAAILLIDFPTIMLLGYVEA